MRARWLNNPSLEEFRDVFKRVEESDFLSGRSGVWSNCNFDWILKESNWTKIQEGNYSNKTTDTKDKIPAFLEGKTII